MDPNLHRYPDPACTELRTALARYVGVEPARIGVGNGSDEGIELLLRAFVEPGEAVVVAEPTYGMYRIAGEAHGAGVAGVPLDDAFDLDVEATLRAAAGAKCIFLCSPKNPTGNRLDPDRVKRLAQAFDGLVIVNEGYVEFSARPSLVPRTRAHRNLLVLRTLSKAWGLASARVGYWVADPEVIEILDRVNLPYPLSATSARAACLARARADEMEARRARILAERERLARRLEGMGYRVLPSDANFLLVRVPGAAAVARQLAERYGIVVRDRSPLPRLHDALRVTVGRPEDTDRLCDALEAIRAGTG